MRTKIYMMDVGLSGMEEAEKQEVLERILPLLSSYRQEKTRQLRFLEDKLCSAGAGLLLERGLEAYGITGRSEPIGFYGNQKPYLKNHPEIAFNLSHSGTMVMAAFADGELGCDIEKDKKANFSVARRFFHEAEQADLERQTTPEAKTDRFYRYWTLKESFLKATGEGMRLAMNRFCIRLEDTDFLEKQKDSGNETLQKPQISVELDGIRKPHHFLEWKLPEYHAALCMEKNPRDIFSLFKIYRM